MVIALLKKRKIIRHHWTEEESRILKEEYDSESGTANRIARQLGVTVSAVYCRAVNMGLARQYFSRWNKEDDDWLRNLVGKHPVSQIVKIMKKSQNVILGRMNRLGLTTKYRDEWYTIQDIIEILHIGRPVLRRCIEEGKLIATYHHGKKPQHGGKSFYHIEEKDLRKFIIDYRYELSGRKVDLPIVIDMLVNHHNPQVLHKQLG